MDKALAVSSLPCLRQLLQLPHLLREDAPHEEAEDPSQNAEEPVAAAHVRRVVQAGAAVQWREPVIDPNGELRGEKPDAQVLRPGERGHFAVVLLDLTALPNLLLE